MNGIQIFYMHNDKTIREKNILTREVMDQWWCRNNQLVFFFLVSFVFFYIFVLLQVVGCNLLIMYVGWIECCKNCYLSLLSKLDIKFPFHEVLNALNINYPQ
jgi:hypothetical protein